MDVPHDVLTRLRAICAALPETHEQPAWTGIRWRVRARTFAHVYVVDDECRLVFRSSGAELDVLIGSGPPFSRVDWGENVVRMTLAQGVDWTEIAELLTESYCVQAPAKLVARVDRPAG